MVPEVEDVMEYPQREDDYQDKADPVSFVWSILYLCCGHCLLMLVYQCCLLTLLFVDFVVSVILKGMESRALPQ